MYSLSSLGIDQTKIKALVLLYFILFVTVFLVSFCLSVLKKVGLYEMGKSLDVRKKWYAFFPFFSDIYIGKIASKNQGKNKSGFILLIFDILCKTVLLLGIIYFVTSFVGVAFKADEFTLSDKAVPTSVIKPLILPLVIIAFSGLLSVIYKILVYINFWKIFSVFTRKATVYIIISIVLPFTLPVFVYSLKDKFVRDIPQKNEQ